MKLIKKIEISGELLLESGMHIGGSNTSMSIGGIDKSIIRNPINNMPYIPGSSLKGKMRSLFELSIGELGGRVGRVTFGPSQDNSKPPAQLFGSSSGDDKQRPSRIIVRDAMLVNPEELQNTELLYSEGKTEVVIDRVTSAANPRQIERVPAGARFGLNIVINVFDGDPIDEPVDVIFQCLKLLKDDYLGGNGSRGYGKVCFEKVSVKEKTVENFYAGHGDPTDITSNFTKAISYLKNEHESQSS